MQCMLAWQLILALLTATPYLWSCDSHAISKPLNCYQRIATCTLLVGYKPPQLILDRLLVVLFVAMSSELPCYTIINNPTETEAPNEQQLKHDLGKADKTI